MCGDRLPCCCLQVCFKSDYLALAGTASTAMGELLFTKEALAEVRGFMLSIVLVSHCSGAHLDSFAWLNKPVATCWSSCCMFIQMWCMVVAMLDALLQVTPFWSGSSILHLFMSVLKMPRHLVGVMYAGNIALNTA